MKVIKAGEKTRFDFQSEDIVGFAFNGFGTNASPAAKLIDFTKVSVNAVLSQRGKEITLFSSDLQTLILESAFFSNSWLYNLPGGTANLSLGSNNHMLPGFVDLRGILNLRGTDKVTLSVSVAADAFTSGWTNTNLSVESVLGIGLQTETPTINVISVMTAETTVKQSLGDNVTSIAFISNDTDADIVKNARLYSDRINTNEDISILRLKRLYDLQGIEIGEIVKRYSNFYFSQQELDKVRVEIDLDGSLVEVSKNFLVYRQYVTDPETIQLASMRNAEHAAYNRQKLGV